MTVPAHRWSLTGLTLVLLLCCGLAGNSVAPFTAPDQPSQLLTLHDLADGLYNRLSEVRPASVDEQDDSDALAVSEVSYSPASQIGHASSKAFRAFATSRHHWRPASRAPPTSRSI
ncbi:hypothetical protein [Litorivivens sp.]|uniref:hypothetical protein n=1 Tax=Litorivivens sp. TaxID=2020868 RepID=UPI003565904A